MLMRRPPPIYMYSYSRVAMCACTAKAQSHHLLRRRRRPTAAAAAATAPASPLIQGRQGPTHNCLLRPRLFLTPLPLGLSRGGPALVEEEEGAVRGRGGGRGHIWLPMRACVCVAGSKAQWSNVKAPRTPKGGIDRSVGRRDRRIEGGPAHVGSINDEPTPPK